MSSDHSSVWMVLNSVWCPSKVFRASSNEKEKEPYGFPPCYQNNPDQFENLCANMGFVKYVSSHTTFL